MPAWIDRHHHTQTLISAALAAVDPYARTLAALQTDSPAGPVHVLALGKAAGRMAQAACHHLGQQVQAGLVITKADHPTAPPLPTVYGGHPLPTDQSVQAAHAVQQLIAHPLPPNGSWLMLLSGGGSALLTAPTPPLTLADLQATTATLLACGASIDQLNAVRKHLSQVAGGQLARQLAPKPVQVLVLSDVIGNPLDVIVSGPFAPDPTTFAECAEVLTQFNLWETLPPPVTQHIRVGVAGQYPETPKPGDPIFAQVRHTLIGDNALALQAAAQAARQLGFAVQVATEPLVGPAEQAAQQVVANATAPGCYLWGGETTVTLPPNPGLGGRNQQVALAGALALAGRNHVRLFTLATDGGDGPTPAAGATAEGDSVARGAAIGLSAQQALANCNAYPFFDALNNLIITGPTGTNVNDLTAMLVYD